MIKPIILVLGPTGSGKSTQAKKIADFLSIDHLSSGEILREKISSGNMSKEFVQRIMRGELCDDETIKDLITGQIKSRLERGLVLDGYPRTETQLESFEKVLREAGASASIIISLLLEPADIKDRILARQRFDDNEEAIRNRLKAFKEQTAKVAEHYRQRGILYEVDGSGDVEQVFERILKVIKEKK